MAAPDIEPILKRPLLFNGRSVPVLLSSRADRYIGEAVATRDGYANVLGKAPDPTFRLNPYALLFFREHEMAHITLGHITSRGGHGIRTGGPEQEFEADCEAVRVLLGFRDGRSVLDRAWSVLNSIPGGDTKTHPAPSKRAKHIDDVCTEPGTSVSDNGGRG